MDATLQPYAFWVYLLVVLNLVLAVWFIYLFFQWRKLVMRRWMKAAFVVVPTLMTGLLVFNVMALFGVIRIDAPIAIFRGYLMAANATMMASLLALATRAVKKGLAGRQGETTANTDEQLAVAGLDGRTTPELVEVARKRVTRIKGMLDGLNDNFLKDPRAI